jgi:hypothetical protein
MNKPERRFDTNSSTVGSRFRRSDDRVPVELKLSSESGRITAVVRIGDAVQNPGLEKEVHVLETEYSNRLLEWNQKIRLLRNSRDNHSLRWNLADEMNAFQEWARTIGFELVNFREALARDVSLSDTWITYLLKLRERYDSPSLLDERIPWTRYHELLRFRDVFKMKRCEEQVKNGTVRSDSEIRAIRKVANAKS